MHETSACIICPTRPAKWRRPRSCVNFRRCRYAVIRFSELSLKFPAICQLRNIQFLVCPDYLFCELGGVIISPTFYLSVGYFLPTISLGHFLSPIFCQSFSSYCLSTLLRRPPRQFRRRRGNYLADAIRPRRGTPRLPQAGSTAIYSRRGMRKFSARICIF